MNHKGKLNNKAMIVKLLLLCFLKQKQKGIAVISRGYVLAYIVCIVRMPQLKG